MTASIYRRRSFLKTSGALLAASGTLGLVSGCATMGSGPKVVVVGGGFGGATAAKYVRMWSDYGINVAERAPLLKSAIDLIMLALSYPASATMPGAAAPLVPWQPEHDAAMLRACRSLGWACTPVIAAPATKVTAR